MNTSKKFNFRTDLASYLMDLLDFVSDRIMTSQNDPLSRTRALGEAMGAFPIIKDRLQIENQNMLGPFMLLGLLDDDLAAISTLPTNEFMEKSKIALQRIQAAREVVVASSS